MNYDVIGYYSPEKVGYENIKKVFGNSIHYFEDDCFENYEFDYIMYIGNTERTLHNLYCKNKINPSKIKSLEVAFKHWWSNIIYDFGELNPDKVFYVINRGIHENVAGLLCFFNDFLMEYKYAKEQGYIPVMDMQNFYTNYSELEEFGKVDVWSKFFIQNNGYSLEEVYQSKHVMFAKGRSVLHQPEQYPITKAYYDNQARKHWNQIYREGLKLSADMEESLDREYIKLLEASKNNKIIGISIRGVDHTRRKPFLHYIAPSYETLIYKLKQLTQEWGMEYIYVNADETSLINELNEAFPGKILYMDRMRYDKYAEALDKTGISKFNKEKPQWVTQVRFNREQDAYLRGKEYLISTLLLTKCNAIVHSGCSSTLGACIMAGEFEQEYYFDLGFYGIEDNAYSISPIGCDIIVNDKPESLKRLEYLHHLPVKRKIVNILYKFKNILGI